MREYKVTILVPGCYMKTIFHVMANSKDDARYKGAQKLLAHNVAPLFSNSEDIKNLCTFKVVKTSDKIQKSRKKRRNSYQRLLDDTAF